MEKIKFEIKNKIGYIKLSAPPKNEMDVAFFKDLSIIIDKVEQNKELIGLIISSTGRHFSSGANIDELLSFFNKSTDIFPKELKGNNTILLKISKLEKPVVACIKGICYGSATELALSAHFRISEPSSRFSLPESSFGLIPGLGGMYHSQKTMGKAQALQFILAEQSLTADKALNMGLIDFLVEKNKAIARAEELILKINEDYRKELKPLYL